VLFLSTSRVYPIGGLRALAYREEDTRFALCEEQAQPGASAHGISEDFFLSGARSFYGTTKLASELLLQEYVFSYGLPALIYRCGVLAGPWQMGRVDQGFMSLWVAAHHYGRPLKYIGFGGTGKQVRDVLHIDDLYDLIKLHISEPGTWDGRTYNVGGGLKVSTSLVELTGLCKRIVGRNVPISSEPQTSPIDVPLYISDCSRLCADTSWRPRRDIETIIRDLAEWIAANDSALRRIFR
jgi:CDP-paratose 2-epimerase